MTLKELRKNKKIQQKNIVIDMNLSVGCVSNWEKGIRTPNIEQIPLLAKCLNTTIENIVLAIIETQNQNKKGA